MPAKRSANGANRCSGPTQLPFSKFSPSSGFRKKDASGMNPAAESGFEALCLRAGHCSRGIRRIWAQKIAGNYRQIEADREFSLASLAREDPEIRPEMRLL